MTKREAAIVMVYTGIVLGDFKDAHAYIEEILGRPVFTHELESENMAKLLKEKSRPDFIAIKITED